ncbi:hypothetical protein QQX98_012575 [Neonectria punicea]|uniref:Plastocyanin-like domain-containing protein n=1 Tax=Neonectria punicea TaxID=979145 RepID=A0ABR1GIG7_9HYPO
MMWVKSINDEKFILDVTNEVIAPDGWEVQRMLFNGTYPGPTLEGNWGDTFNPKHICHGCLDEMSLNPKSIVHRNVTLPANTNFTKESYKVHLVGYPDEYKEDLVLYKWVLKDLSFYLDWSEPSLSLVKIASEKGWKEPKFPKGYEPVDLDYKDNSWVYFLIEGKFQESLDNTTLNNPGVWLMHCHIAWHASGGLALQFVESPHKIGPAFMKSGIFPKYSETCANWGAYYAVFNKNNNATQKDSGV